MTSSLRKSVVIDLYILFSYVCPSFITTKGILTMKIVSSGMSFTLAYGETIEDNLIAHANTFIHIYGLVTGDIDMKELSNVEISGEVKGTVYNNGGNLHIDGIVSSVVENGGVTTTTNTTIIRDRIK